MPIQKLKEIFARYRTVSAEYQQLKVLHKNNCVNSFCMKDHVFNATGVTDSGLKDYFFSFNSLNKKCYSFLEFLENLFNKHIENYPNLYF